MNNLLDKIENLCQTPYYLFYRDRFIYNITSFRDAFKSFYDKVILAYSFKTNYTPPLLTEIKNYGGYAETVSAMEYEMAMKLGFLPENIIFNGPIKNYNDIKKAIINKSILHLDSEYEVDLLEKLRAELPDIEINVGLRINMELVTDNGKSAIQAGFKESRFGMTDEVLFNIIPKIKRIGAKIISLHGHTSSTNRVSENYVIIAKKLLTIQKEFNLNDIKYFDVGGGFLGAAPQCIDVSNKPSYEDYAREISMTFLENEWFRKHKPYIVIEPGTSVVCNVFDLVTKIHQHKCIRGKNLVFVDASIFMIKSSLSKVNYPFDIYSKKPLQKRISANIVGSTCMEVDVISQNVDLEHYSYGDNMVFRGVGAYRNNMTPFFINSRPPIVEVIDNDNFRILRDRQTVDEMIDLLKY